MKLFKLIKSIDYVTYPAYKELVRISNTVSDSVRAFRDILISAIAGVLFNLTPLSNLILSKIKGQSPSGIIEKIINYENTPIFISIIAAIIIYGGINLVKAIQIRWGSNKNTKPKRDILVYEFYNVAIPQLVEVKSILEQIDENQSIDERKKVLLLLQAKHEICNLYEMLSEMRIIEREKSGCPTIHSNILSDRISPSAYNTFLREMLANFSSIYKDLSVHCNGTLVREEELDDIRACINKTGVFDQVDSIRDALEDCKKLSMARVMRFNGLPNISVNGSMDHMLLKNRIEPIFRWVKSF